MSADRTLPATPRRREDAHRRGLLPCSDGLAWCASALVLIVCLPVWLRRVGSTFAIWLMQLPDELANPQLPPGGFTAQLSWQLAWPTVMLLAVTTATGLGVRLIIDRPRLIPGRLSAFRRINPLHGFQRMVSLETARQLCIGLLATALFAVAMRWAFSDLAVLVRTDVLSSLEEASSIFWLAWRALWGVTCVASVVAALQHFIRWRASERKLRMTPEELREEQRLVEANTRVRLPSRDTPAEPGDSFRHPVADH